VVEAARPVSLKPAALEVAICVKALQPAPWQRSI
jgi:hypothetical protein